MSAEKLITEHLDLWTGAIVSKSSSGRGSNSKIELAGIRKLRELILALAVRGKLVEQNTNDEPAALLLQRLATPKQRPIGKASRKKANDTSHTEDEKLFCIPENWCWAALPEIAHYKPGRTPSTKDSKFWSKDMFGTPWVSIADMEHFGTIRDTSKRITEIAAKTVFRSDPVKPGSILMSFKLTVGKISINEVPVYHNEAIISIEPAEGIHRDYLFKVLPMLALGGNTKRAIMGNTLNATSLAQILVPVPPKEEQARIVQKVDELMALCDRLEQQTSGQLEAHEILVDTLLGTLTQSENATDLADNWVRLATHFDTLFTTEQSIDKLKQTILQLAVMGRLVEQDAADEPACELLQRVAKEKTMLVAEGRIKMQKPLSEIGKEEKQFDLPIGWQWARFGDVCAIRGELVRPEDFPDLRQIAPDCIEKGTGLITENRTVRESGVKGPNSRFFSGQIVYSKIRPSLSKAVVVDFDGLCSADMYPIDAFIDSKFLLMEILSEIFLEQVRVAENRIKMPKLNQESLASFVLPIPPLAEQRRIVQKVDELMDVCDQLKECVNQASKIRCQLAEAIVEGALH